MTDGLNPAGPPRKVGLIDGGREITYEELRARISALAGGLRARFEAGDLLAIWLPNGAEILCLYFACFKAGVVPLPLHVGMKGPEVRDILNSTRVKALITAQSIVDPHAEELRKTSLEQVYVVGPALPTKPFRPFSELMGGTEVTGHPTLPPDRLSLVLHTSGSNGRAKGVMLSAATLHRILDHRRVRAGFASDSVAVVASCLTQSVGLYQTLAMLAAGGTVVLLEAYDIDAMVEKIDRHRPTHLILVVDAWDRLLHHPKIAADSLRRLRFASAGADRLTARVQDRFIALTGRPLAVTYGLTESSWALVNPGDRADKRLSLGKRAADVSVRIRAEGGGEAAVGDVGEMLVRSPRTMSGYWGDEDLTRHTLVDGWLATGDLAHRDEDGYFWFAGRTKNLIVLASGDNVSPLEVERVILSHPAVSHCAVVGVATPEGSEVPHAWVTRRDESLTANALDLFLRQRLSDFKIPRHIRFVAEIPVGLTGKLQMGTARTGRVEL